MSITLLVIVLALLLFFSCIRLIEQNTVAVIEFLGKYRRTMTAGFNLKIPLLEKIAERITLRQQNFKIDGQ